MINPDARRNRLATKALRPTTRCWPAPFGQTLADPAKDRFSEDDYEFLKFHGIYQQDDRDKRKTAKQYIYMVRGRLPGGAVSAVGLSGVRPALRPITAITPCASPRARAFNFTA